MLRGCQESVNDVPADERLESWEGIATHRGREVRTAQPWGKTEGLPVRRHKHRKLATVYASANRLLAGLVPICLP